MSQHTSHVAIRNVSTWTGFVMEIMTAETTVTNSTVVSIQLNILSYYTDPVNKPSLDSEMIRELGHSEIPKLRVRGSQVYP